MNYDLPTSIEIDGAEHPIRTDFRAALDIMEALQDPELDDNEKILAALDIFYLEDPETLPDLQTAVAALYWFLDGGQDRGNDKAGPRLVDWGHDWERIIAPVNRVLGFDARTVRPDADGAGLHWWTFLAAYMEIGGDCLLSQVVQIREKIKRGKRLDKSEREWYRRNRSMVDLPTNYTEAEKEIERQWTKG